MATGVTFPAEDISIEWHEWMVKFSLC